MLGTKIVAAILVAGTVTANAMTGTMEKNAAISETAAATTNPISKYIYPGAQIANVDGDSYVLVAEATLDEATNWYNKAFEANRMKDKNVIKSDSNGEKINLIMGSGLPGEVDVAIKEETNNLVTIAITHNFSASSQI